MQANNCCDRITDQIMDQVTKTVECCDYIFSECPACYITFGSGVGLVMGGMVGLCTSLGLIGLPIGTTVGGALGALCSCLDHGCWICPAIRSLFNNRNDDNVGAPLMPEMENDQQV